MRIATVAFLLGYCIPAIAVAQASLVTLDLAPCALRVAVDGLLREAGFPVNSIPPAEVYGVEIYPGPATIPAEYATM